MAAGIGQSFQTAAASGPLLLGLGAAALAGLPFVALAFGSTSALAGLGWLRRNTRAIQLIGGVLLIAVGAALVTGAWELFVGWLRDQFVTSVVLPI